MKYLNYRPLLTLFLIFSLTTLKAMAQTGLPMPRFVSLKSEKVNLRHGPGKRYPINWILVYKHMPVEIIAEFKDWRKVREWQGSVGWIKKTLLSGQRWVIIKKGPQILHRSGRSDSRIIAKIGTKVIGKLKKCTVSWWRIQFQGYTGWMQHNQFWGVYPLEKYK